MPKQRQSFTGEEEHFIKNIGFRVQYFRKKKGMSQFELAEQSGLSYTTISHLESTSTHVISLVTLFRIAKALNVEPHQLLQFD